MTRVLSALLREDVVGLRTRSTLVRRPDGAWLQLADGQGRFLLLPVVEDGFQCEYAARLPLLVGESQETVPVPYETCDEILGALRALADPIDQDGFDAFAEECRQTLATMRLHDSVRAEVTEQLTERHGATPADWTGPNGGLAYDTLAAHLDHPVYPTARGRSGLTEEQLRSYAPEFNPRFALRWLAVPRESLSGTLPERWPTPERLGLAGLEGTHVALPVHPLTVGTPLEGALRATGLADRAVLAERAHLEVVPTLSMRTVALSADPSRHIKLPLPTATLGLRNRRTIKPGTLVDGAAGQRLIERVVAREPRFRSTILHADETVYAHAGHELLAALFRRYPAGLQDSVVVPMAALLAEAPGGRLVVDHLADRFYGGDPLALLDAWLVLLFDWQTTLFRYGIALESHQQNISLVLDRRSDGHTRLRLLLKDNDGPRINAARLRERLGDPLDEPLGGRLGDDALGGPWGFDDARTFGESDQPVVDLFTTVTVHLCAGAYAFGFARHGRAPLPVLLRLVRDRLAEAIERLGTGAGEPGAVLRARVLDSPRLPVKAMVTAGTLLTKERSGAADINKHYTNGPNYLLRTGDSA
ncbi:IucA/IucC family siderophore biosynthesis protein [Streptomyces sp. NBC_00878]|uniref:IucA/IucC family siderophore biosynthesis protein n=1 Tax=Streptomyces sp. NBC_00878 TaxID=2975854 RepID=UPI002259316C|nr:IucA/IucC family siderophore biosynthesis protein [Streptomyces sp. NBC_00878]MCX4911718.1 IucA/IucC family siderophore biosynthesis protein [Streptomyces sp. NBC_00878]